MSITISAECGRSVKVLIAAAYSEVVTRAGRPDWWRRAVVYQAYIRSFADSNGDGIGDLGGIRARLDHLVGLGVDAVWLNPCYPSPQVDHGYDISDYFDIHHEYGDLRAFDELVEDARRAGIRVLMDLVPNHCSDQHPRFQAALAAPPGSAERAMFWFRDGRSGDGDPHGAPPNNWQSAFGGPAWTRADDDDPQWYLGTFTPQQPDFDHRSPDVQAMFDAILRFWFDRGVDGFRVDAISPVGKHPDLPDQPPVPEDTDVLQITWLNEFTVFRPEGHDVWRRLRSVVDDYERQHPERTLMMVAEAYMARRPDLVEAFTQPDQFHQVFAFDVMLAPWDAGEIELAISDTMRVLDRGVSPCWTLNNHDIQRIVTRLGRADAADPSSWTGNNLLQSDADIDEDLGRRRALALFALVMALPGSLYLYQGEELGLPEVLDLPPSARRDPVFFRTGGARLGRDGCRIPLPWTDDPLTSFGFSEARPHRRPWLPQPDDWGRLSATTQSGAPTSTLEMYRRLLAVRRHHLADQPDAVAILDAPAGMVVIRRGSVVVAMNTTHHPVAIDVGTESGTGSGTDVDTAAEIVVSTAPLADAARPSPRIDVPGNATVLLAITR
jgi:alpha-glucosidase